MTGSRAIPNRTRKRWLHNWTAELLMDALRDKFATQSNSVRRAFREVLRNRLEYYTESDGAIHHHAPFDEVVDCISVMHHHSQVAGAILPTWLTPGHGFKKCKSPCHRDILAVLSKSWNSGFRGSYVANNTQGEP